MKKVLIYLNIAVLLALAGACTKYDNYAPPKETLTGSVVDAETGAGVQTDGGGSGTRLKLMELSWSDSPTPYYFYCMQDGSFNNTKIFKGKYKISPEGPFVPVIQNDASGKVTVDNSQTIEVSGVTKLTFKVVPFLRLEWVGDPIYDAASGNITVKVKMTRGTDNLDFQQNITDIFLFVSPNTYVGNANRDDRYSHQIKYNGSSANTLLGTTITMDTKGQLPAHRSYSLRIGARIQYGLNYYNYTTIKSVDIP